MKKEVASVLIWIWVALPCFSAGKAPQFGDYLTDVAAITLRRADTSTHPKALAISQKYRTMFVDAAKEGPNFAGRYSIVRWGCGSGCVEWAIVNLNSGKIIFDDAFSCLMGIPGWDLKGDSLELRKDSSLIVAQGVANEPGLAKRYYLNWNGARLRLLASELVFDGRLTREQLEAIINDPKTVPREREYRKIELMNGNFKR